MDWARSPFHRAHKGSLGEVRPDDLAAHVIKDLISRNEIELSDFDDVLMGCGYPEAEQGYNIGRLVPFLAGFPDSARYDHQQTMWLFDAGSAICSSQHRVGLGGLLPMCGSRVDEQGEAQGFQLVASPRSRAQLAGGLRHYGADR